MTGPVPPPLAPAAVSPGGHPPLAESSVASGQNRGPGQPIDATVVAITRQGPLIEAGGQRFLVSGAPTLPTGASLSLELAGAGRQATGRLLAVAGRALEPPVTIRLQVVPPHGEPARARRERSPACRRRRGRGPPARTRWSSGRAADPGAPGRRRRAGAGCDRP